MRFNPLPPVEFLRQCFSYDPESGELRWKQRPPEHFATTQAWSKWDSVSPGTIAGWIDYKGYYEVPIGEYNYKAHRIIWKLMTGDDPTFQIDHRDTDKSNNRWNNLRHASNAEQKYNADVRVDNVSGYRGVKAVGKKWMARIYDNGKSRYLGLFPTPELASAAYEAVAQKLHGEFYRQRKDE